MPLYISKGYLLSAEIKKEKYKLKEIVINNQTQEAFSYITKYILN